MSSNRSVWSCVLLSAAVIATSALSTVWAQDAATAPAATETAPAADAVAPAEGSPEQLAEDFLHYTRVNSVEMANASGKALLDKVPDSQTLLKAFEAAANGRDFRAIVEAATRRDETKDIAATMLSKLDEGYRGVIRDRARILIEIQRLDKGNRPNMLARDRLAAAGQYAVPVMISVLQDNTQEKLHPFILKAMVEIGRPLLPPLLEQLNMSEQANKVALIKVVGEMGYPQPLPILARLASSPKNTEEVRAAAIAAIAAIQKARPLDGTPAELFLRVAENYLIHAPGYQAPDPDEATNAIWSYQKEIDNVVGHPVPTAIWADILAQKNAEQCLTLQHNNSSAISLWIAAGFKRELELPAGAKDPMKDDAKISAETIGYASGAIYLNPVLTLALDRNDVPLILRTLQSLDKVAGIVGLVPPRQVADASTKASVSDATPATEQLPPVVRCLSYPDMAVRFKAAEILARINPNERFVGYFRVVQVLSEAIQTGSPNVLLVDSDTEHRLKLKDSLHTSAAAYNVYDGSTLNAALDAGKKAPAFDMILITNSPEVARVRDIGRTDYRLVNPPVLVLAPASQIAVLKAEIAGAKGIGVIPAGTVDEPVVTQAAQAARGGAASPLDKTAAAAYSLSAINSLLALSNDHASIYRVEDAQPALTDAIRDVKRPEIAIAAAGVLGKFNRGAEAADAQRSLTNAALSVDITDNAVRIALFDSVAESARRNGNQLDAQQIDKLIKTVSSDQDLTVRAASARALGALNVPSNQASNLILQQITK
jgi:hypothetical protein